MATTTTYAELEEQAAAAAAQRNEEYMEQGNGRRTLDPELRAMANILRILEELSPAAQKRTLMWLAMRCRTEYLISQLVNFIREDDGTPE